MDEVTTANIVEIITAIGGLVATVTVLVRELRRGREEDEEAATD